MSVAPLLALLLSLTPPPPPGEGGWTQPTTAPAQSAAALATHELRTPRFRIVATERASGAARYLAGEIEGLRDEVAEAIGRDWPGVTEVRVGFGREEYEALALPGGAPPAWAVALAYPGHNIVLVEARSLTRGDGQQTLRHELVHVGLGQLGRGWPRWFQEGLAQQLTGEREYRFEHFTTLARAVARDEVYRFDDLAADFPSRPSEVEVAYAQSAAFISFLRERHGKESFGVLIDRVGAGDAFETAFGVAFHSPLSAEERLFRDELPLRFPWWPLLLSGGTVLWVLMSLLTVAAWARRRRQRAQWGAEALRVECLEELALAVASDTSAPANDERSLDLWRHPSWAPWRAHSVRGLVVRAGREDDGSAEATASPPGT